MIRNWIAGLTLLALAAIFDGCNTPQANPKPDGKETPKGTAESESGHGWWCDEHGVPEAECALCDSKVAAECQKKGDWCQEHGTAKSQCFKCDPKLQEKFAEKYRTKFGKEPPKL